MNWINEKKFQLVKQPGRHYVFRRNSTGKKEINVPLSIQTKIQAQRWLKNNPNKLAPHQRSAALKLLMIGGKTIQLAVPKEPTYLLNARRMKGNKIPWTYTCDLKRQLKVFKAIGKGRQGIVYIASRYTNSRLPFAIKIAPKDLRAESRREKQPAQVEYDIHVSVQKAAPDGVVEVYQMFNCDSFVRPEQINMPEVQGAGFDRQKQAVILMEYCKYGTMRSWLNKEPVSDATLFKSIKQIVMALYNIRKSYPNFNHNDLHIDNVFVSERGALIGDFGWARLEKNGTNPAVNSANGTRTASYWGVGPKTDPRYDYHFFLNDLRDWLVKRNAEKFPKTVAFLREALPLGYRGKNTEHVIDWRLKYGDPCPGLPSLEDVVSLLNPKLKPKPPSPKALSPEIKKEWSNANLIKISAANFVKLSPASRERARRLRAVAVIKTNLVKVPKKVDANATQRVKKIKSPPKNASKHKPIPKNTLKSNKFNKLIEKIRVNQGGPANESYYEARNRARTKALVIIQNRINKNLPAFSLSPTKNRGANTTQRVKKINLERSPGSKRLKIKAPNTGRMVYVNGARISLDYLKTLAKTLNVNVSGLRSKTEIANRIFYRISK
jgi:hypothetical protein